MAVVEKNPDTGRAIIDEYLHHQDSIFRRLAIHNIRLNMYLWPDLLESLFTDFRYLEDRDVYHEYWLLMNDAFGSLPNPVQESFIEQLLDKLPENQMEDETLYHHIFAQK